MKRKWFSIFLALAMLLSIAPLSAVTAFAASGTLTVKDGSNSIISPDANGNYTISQGGDYTITGDGSATASTVTVMGGTANITLDNVDIVPSSGCAFSVSSGAAVNLTLTGTNVLKSGSEYAGLQVPNGAALTVTNTSTGSLDAEGGEDGAGIGGSGGIAGTDSRGGSITINGGTVTATGGRYGAGIGGGSGITGRSGEITISGGTVTATGGEYGAGIGEGYGCTLDGTDIYINGTGTHVRASGSSYAISTNNLSVGTSSNSTPSLPTLELASGGISETNPSYYINCVIVGTGAESAGIAGVYASDSTRTAPSDVSSGSVSITNDGTYVITGTSTSDTVTVNNCTAYITLDNVNIAIASGNSGCAFQITGGATVYLTLVGTNTLDTSASSSNCAGLSVGEGNTVFISGTGSLTAKGGNLGAGIGGSAGGNGGTTTISGGTVIANGGNGGAGIGGGAGGTGGTTTISGGTVTANGNSGGAGIGGGNLYYSGGDFLHGNGGTVTVSGGTVIADGGSSGAGIGGGNGAAGGTVEITGAGTSVKAKGQNSGYDIGSGSGSSSGGNLAVGDTNAAAPLPAVTLESAGTNAATTFKNCTITNSADAEMTGTYNAVGYIPTAVALSASDSSAIAGETLTLTATVSGYTGGGTVQFLYEASGETSFTDISSAASVDSSSKAAQTFTPASTESYTFHAEYASPNGYRKGNAACTVGAASTYTIVYTLNGGTNSSQNAATTYTYGGTAVTLYAPERDGYTFGGWYTDSGFASTAVTEINDALAAGYSSGATINLYAKWTANSTGGGYYYTTYYTLTASVGVGGSISPDGSSSIIYGGGKTYTITPTDGYEIKDVLVDGVSVGAVSSYTFENVKKAHAIAASFAKKKTVNPFADVKVGDWFYDSVMYVRENGIMAGTDSDLFSPDAAMTRQMIWMVLVRMDGKAPANMDEAKAWAVENKISDGTNPEDSITREQLAVILYRYAQYKGCDTTQGGMAIREFTDYDSISEYALPALGWAVNAGLMQGSGNQIMPLGTATRAQVAAILMRFSQNVTK